MTSPRLAPETYTIGIICALFTEKAAVEAMLDEEHEALVQNLRTPTAIHSARSASTMS